MYYILPRLVKDNDPIKTEIAEHKTVKTSDLTVGESIEFDIESYVVPVNLLEKIDKTKYPYILATADSDKVEIVNKINGIVKLNELEAKEIFGTRVEPGFKVKIGQETGTPYQNSTKRESTTEHTRFESWYMFTPMKMTLGLKDDVDVEAYKKACLEIYALSQKLSKELKSGKITIREANKQLEDLIEVVRPDKYVNKLPLRANTIIDFTKGGIHYSVEEDPTNPKGAMVFKVLKTVSDSDVVSAAYAKGELSESGELSKLDIEKYFDNLEANIVDNNTKNRIKTSIKLKDLKGWKLNKIFNLVHYQTDELILFKDYKIEDLGFRHFFVRDGKGILKVDDTKIEISQGESYIIPFNAKVVMLKNTTPKPKTEEESKLRVLLTYKREHLKR